MTFGADVVSVLLLIFVCSCCLVGVDILLEKAEEGDENVYPNAEKEKTTRVHKNKKQRQ